MFKKDEMSWDEYVKECDKAKYKSKKIAALFLKALNFKFNETGKVFFSKRPNKISTSCFEIAIKERKRRFLNKVSILASYSVSPTGIKIIFRVKDKDLIGLASNVADNLENEFRRIASRPFIVLRVEKY
ncbi:MAG: hypothetical protein ACMXX5_00610 [Candidatus Woesearchaeota archaeon]